ncbi:MAG TPA: hypothetical protein VHI31_06515, partial [Actinomycetota bacterium]|nr:hypothetical protein [Actinomycetota bacterium]
MNYELVCNDFGDRVGWRGHSTADAGLQRRIDRWLVKTAAVISTMQAGQTVANSRIPTIGEPRTIYRPPRYFRAALVADTESPDHVIDVKGVGMPQGHPPRLPEANG